MRVGIIGGTGLYDAIAGITETKDTEYGSVKVTLGKLRDVEVAFINRHAVGGQHKILPHQVNYRATIKALKDLDVTRIFGVAAVGGIMPEMEVGDIYIPKDVIDMTHSRSASFFGLETGIAGHLICENLLCPEMGPVLINELPIKKTRDQHVYVCTNGPRLETPAEIRYFQSISGTLVGMTLMPEAALAAELGMCYVSINVVVNPAAGVRPGFKITLKEIKKVMAKAQEEITKAIIKVAKILPTKRGCGCGDEGRVIYM